MLLIIVIFEIIGFFNFFPPKKTEIEISINKTNIEQQLHKELNIVAVSDLHIGSLINKKRLKSYIDTINNQNPDIVFIVGDLIDSDMRPVIKQNMHEELSSIKAKYGTYAVLGNHEYIGGDSKFVVDYLNNSGINVLVDTAVLVNDEFYVVGRNDRGFGSKRKTTAELVSNLEHSKPIILLDHQPYNLVESENAGVDLHLSGHTHDGQFFPINLITKLIYETPHGYLKKGNTHCYVSSGMGT